jgi:hypothetical protein
MRYIRFGHRSSNAEVLRAIQSNAIPHAMRLRHWYRQLVQVGDFVGEGDSDQTLTLNTLYPRNTFPTDVDLLEGATVVNRTLPVGTSLTAASLRLGGVFAAGTDDDGLLTVSNWLGSGAAVGDVLNTPSAANYANRYEAAFSPQVRIVFTGAFLSAATAGAFEVFIPWTPRPERSS